MRLHTDTLTAQSIRNALYDCGLYADGVHFAVLSPHRSRSRAQAFEVRLAADEGRDRFAQRRRVTHSGAYGAGPYTAATYDEWGILIAALFDLDPEMTFGPYTSRAAFHKQTNLMYATDDHSRATRRAMNANIRDTLARGQSAQDETWAVRDRVQYVRRVRDGLV